MHRKFHGKWLWVTIGVALGVPLFLGYFGRELLAALIIFTFAFLVFMGFAAIVNGMHLAWSALRDRAEAASALQALPLSNTRFRRPHLSLARLSRWLQQRPETPQWLQSLRLSAGALAERFAGIARVAFRHPR